MEPRPLLEDGATEIEKVLLRAGRADGPRKEAGAHLLAVISARPSTPGGPHAGPAGSAVKPVAYARLVKVVLLAVGVGGVATHYLARPARVAPAVLPTRPVVSETVPVAVPGEAPGSPGARAALPPPSVSSAGEDRGRRASHVGRARDREAARETGDSPVDRSLGIETRALDRVRESLDARRPTEALRLLDEYQRNFPQGRLRPEAMVLRLAALVRAGRHGAADTLAGQLLADEAYQTYAPRIRSLLREAHP